MCDRIAVFEHGRIVQVGSGEDLYHRPATAFVAGFIGNSNFLRGSVAERKNDAALVRLGTMAWCGWRRTSSDRSAARCGS